MKLFFIGNWKMNFLRSEAQQFIDGFREIYRASANCEVGIAPSFTSLQTVSEALHSPSEILLGAQNVHWLESGAHTGEVSPTMLKEFGVQFVILGHSERRLYYGETDKSVALRARGAIDHGLRACVCVGESREVFDSGRTLDVIGQQLRTSLSTLKDTDTNNLVVCYEPVWAIGAGQAATPEQAANVHGEIRRILQELFPIGGRNVRVLYGGSVSASNIAGFTSLPDVHGVIVGGASLDPEKFTHLIENGCRARA